MSGMADLAAPGAAGHPGDADEEGAGLPGLGVLVRNEILKTRHRRAFWVGFLFFLLIVLLQSVGPFYRALDTGNPQYFRLPDAWPSILLGAGSMPGMFAAIVVVLLIASEWTWKTARQNVIDGLSKDQFFQAKALGAAMVVLAFVGGQVALAGGMAWWHTPASAFPYLGARDLVMAAGLVVMSLGYTSIAFLAAFLVRSTGSAIGVFFIYIALVENLLGAAMGRWDWSEPLARYLPTQVFGGLAQAAQYEPERQAVVARRMEQAGREAPEYFDTGLLFALAAAWIAAFGAGAYLAHRKRDL